MLIFYVKTHTKNIFRNTRREWIKADLSLGHKLHVCQSLHSELASLVNWQNKAKHDRHWSTTCMNLLPPRIPWRTRPSITHSNASQKAREFNRRSHDETWCFGELRKSSTDIPATSRRVERSCAVSCWGASGHACKGLITRRFKT